MRQNVIDDLAFDLYSSTLAEARGKHKEVSQTKEKKKKIIKINEKMFEAINISLPQCQSEENQRKIHEKGIKRVSLISDSGMA